MDSSGCLAMCGNFVGRLLVNMLSSTLFAQVAPRPLRMHAKFVLWEVAGL